MPAKTQQKFKRHTLEQATDRQLCTLEWHTLLMSSSHLPLFPIHCGMTRQPFGHTWNLCYKIWETSTRKLQMCISFLMVQLHSTGTRWIFIYFPQCWKLWDLKVEAGIFLRADMAREQRTQLAGQLSGKLMPWCWEESTSQMPRNCLISWIVGTQPSSFISLRHRQLMKSKPLIRRLWSQYMGPWSCTSFWLMRSWMSFIVTSAAFVNDQLSVPATTYGDPSFHQWRIMYVNVHIIFVFWQ